MKLPRNILAASAAALMLGVSAEAHTISIGTFNAGSPGSVTIAMGTYQPGHGTVLAEGSISLTSGPSAPLGPIAFGGLTSTQPSGLINSGPLQNNFYTNGPGDPNYNALTNTTGDVIVFWQTATITGLAAGTYTYQITGMNTVNWANDGTGAANWTGTLVIPNTSVNGVPDGGSSIALLGLAMTAAAGFRRKFAL